MSNDYDLSDAGEQRDVIPGNSVVTLEMTIKQGGAGDGWLTTSKSGDSAHLNCMLTVVGGQYDGRKFWTCLTLQGKTPGHEEARRISRGTLKAILQSAHGIKPDDSSEAAKKALEIANWGAFDGLKFKAVVGVQPPSNGYSAKNILQRIITPEQVDWESIAQTTKAPGAAAAPPANAISRPAWADGE
jgi:hypothetical protein